MRALIEARKGGSRLASHELEVEEDIFEEVPEEEAARREKREREAIEDDGEGDYFDDDDDKVYSDEEDGPSRRKTKAPAAKGALNRQAPRKPPPNPAKRPASMLGRTWQPGGAAAAGAGAAVVPSASAGHKADDSFMNSLLGELDAPAVGGGFGAAGVGAARGSLLGALAGSDGSARPAHGRAAAVRPARSVRDQLLSGRVDGLDSTPAPRSRAPGASGSGSFHTAERARPGAGGGGGLAGLGGFGGFGGAGRQPTAGSAEVAALLAAGDGGAGAGGFDNDGGAGSGEEMDAAGCDGGSGDGMEVDGGADGDAGAPTDARPFSKAQEAGAWPCAHTSGSVFSVTLPPDPPPPHTTASASLAAPPRLSRHSRLALPPARCLALPRLGPCARFRRACCCRRAAPWPHACAPPPDPPGLRPDLARLRAGAGEDWFTVCLEAAPPSDADADTATATGGAPADGAAAPCMGPTAGSGGGGVSACLPPLDPEGRLLFYFIDCYEDQYNHPGVLHLFGKAYTGNNDPKTGEAIYSSVCVTLRNLERHLFVAPRDGASMNDVYAPGPLAHSAPGPRMVMLGRALSGPSPRVGLGGGPSATTPNVRLAPARPAPLLPDSAGL